MPDDPLLSTEAAAALLGVDRNYLRKLAGRYGIKEERGWRKSLIEMIPRVGWQAGQGRRTDLHHSPETTGDQP